MVFFFFELQTPTEHEKYEQRIVFTCECGKSGRIMTWAHRKSTQKTTVETGSGSLFQGSRLGTRLADMLGKTESSAQVFVTRPTLCNCSRT